VSSDIENDYGIINSRGDDFTGNEPDEPVTRCNGGAEKIAPNNTRFAELRYGVSRENVDQPSVDGAGWRREAINVLGRAVPSWTDTAR